MTHSKHTPGPWMLNEGATGDLFISGADNTYVCEIGAPEEDSVLPDAHLIAAAPDLLALLQEIGQWDFPNGMQILPEHIRLLRQWPKQARTAIEKAAGRA